MRTEQDVRRVLALREDLVPDPDAVLAGVRRVGARRRRQRVGAAVTGAAVAVALVATLPFVLSGLGSPRRAVVAVPAASTTSAPAARTPAPTGVRPPFAFTVDTARVAGFEIEPLTVNPDVQTAAIRPSGADQQRATLFVYKPGTNTRVGGDAMGWEVWTDKQPTRVSVNGATGWYTANEEASALRWEYARDGWAVIGSNYRQAPLTLEAALALAEGVRFVAPYQARVPYRLDYLPAGYVPFHLVQDTRSAGSYRSVVQLQGQGRQYAIDISIADGGSWPPKWKGKPTTIAGHSARCVDLIDGRRCAVDLGEFMVDLGCGGLTASELSRLVAGIRPATWSDPTTWSAVNTVFPGIS